MNTVDHSGVQHLRGLSSKAGFLNLPKADRLALILANLHRLSPAEFEKLNNLTWPQGQAVLLGKNETIILRTNRTAQIKPIPKSPFFFDAGHDTGAMQRLVELVMRELAYDPRTISLLKAALAVSPHSRTAADYV